MQSTAKKPVQIYDPDRRLQIKIGVVNLGEVFTSESVEKAERVIERSADDLLADSLVYLEKLRKAYQRLSREPSQRRDILPEIADTAFRIKTETGMAHYTLLSELAKSLQLHTEEALKKGFFAKNYLIMDWHVSSLDRLFSLKVKGVGGEMGEAILGEIRKISPNPDDDALPATTPRNSFRSAMLSRMEGKSAASTWR